MGNGRTIRFLHYVWIPELGELHNHLRPGVYMLHSLKVVDLVDSTGCWRLRDLEAYFSKEKLDYIVACSPPNDALGEDTCMWKVDKCGKFTIKAAYNRLTRANEGHSEHDWQLV